MTRKEHSKISSFSFSLENVKDSKEQLCSKIAQKKYGMNIFVQNEA